MPNEDRKINKRLSISLDPDSVHLIQRFQTKWGVPKSEIVRRALEYLDAISWEEYVPPETLNRITKTHSRPDKVTIDIGIVRALTEEINETSEKFEEKIQNIGRQLYREYREMGFSAPGDYIKALERNTNLFESVKNSENSFTLISTSQGAGDLLKMFLEGFLNEVVSEAEIRATHGKIRVKLNPSSAS